MKGRLDGGPPVSGISKPISRLALGTAFYRLENKPAWFGILDDFVSSGGTLVDTGRAYGESEEVLGEWLASRNAREHVVLITKCGHGPDGILPTENFRDVVTEELRQSLERLRTDYVDLYMLHRDNPSIPVSAVIDRLNIEITQGRVHAIGASNWDYSRICKANQYAEKSSARGFAAVSNNLSLAMPSEPFWPGVLSADGNGECWHQETGVPLIAWSAQARGFFGGSFSPSVRNDVDNIKDSFTRKMFEVYGTDENFEKLKRAKELGDKKGGYSATQIALAWLLHKPFAIVPVVGPHTREELSSCIAALSLELTETELSWLDAKS